MITTKQINSGLAFVGIALSGFLLGFLSSEWANDTIQPLRPSYEDVKAYTDTLAESNPAKLAVICKEYSVVAETVEIPVWLTPECEITECDCEPDYTQGYSDGIIEGWKTQQAITEVKEPLRTAKEARDFRNSRQR